jgi:predicted RNA-binding protein with RPS1 domain
MSHTLTASLVANALQKLEAIQHNETEVLSDEACRLRAEEVADTALKAVAVCVKYLLAQNGSASIEGLGDLYLVDDAIRFAPELDTLQYAVLKQQPPERHQLALRNAFVRGLSELRKLIPVLGLAAGVETATEENAGTAEEKLLRAIFGETAPNKFDKAISLILTAMIKDLRNAGISLLLSDMGPQPALEPNQIEVQSDFAARLYTVQIPTDKIRDLIGPGGQMIRAIVEQTGAKIDVEDSGLVKVTSSDQASAAKALQIIGDLTATPEVGKTYLGKVTRLTDFGAFVEILPGTDGLLHISEVAEHRVAHVRDELKEGDQVLVKVLAVEGNRIRLSHKAILKEQRANMRTASEAEAEPKADFLLP